MWKFLIDYKHYHILWTFSHDFTLKPKVNIEEDRFAFWAHIHIFCLLIIFADWNRFFRRIENASRKTKEQ